MAAVTISVVTVYQQQPLLLLHLLRAVKAQRPYEHLVVAGEEDQRTRWLVEAHGAKYLPFTAAASLKDGRGVGMYAATGKYVTFWDEHFAPAPDALDSFTNGPMADVVIGRVRLTLIDHRHQRLCPAMTTPPYTLPLKTDVYAAGLCVRRELAAEEDWRRIPGDRPDDHDYTWLLNITEAGAKLVHRMQVVGDVVV